MNEAAIQQPAGNAGNDVPSPDEKSVPAPQTTSAADPTQESSTPLDQGGDTSQVGSENEKDKSTNFDLIMKIPVTVQVILGTAKMPVAKLMKLGRNAVIPLDRQVGDPIDVVVNGRTVARGEVVLMEDDSSRFGISISEIVGTDSTEK